MSLGSLSLVESADVKEDSETQAGVSAERLPQCGHVEAPSYQKGREELEMRLFVAC